MLLNIHSKLLYRNFCIMLCRNYNICNTKDFSLIIICYCNL